MDRPACGSQINWVIGGSYIRKKEKRKKSPKRIISASGELGPLQMVSKLYIR